MGLASGSCSRRRRARFSGLEGRSGKGPGDPTRAPDSWRAEFFRKSASLWGEECQEKHKRMEKRCLLAAPGARSMEDHADPRAQADSVGQRHLRTPATGRWQAFSKASGTCCQVMDFVPGRELLNGSRAPEHGPGPASLSLTEAPQDATTALESPWLGLRRSQRAPRLSDS